MALRHNDPPRDRSHVPGPAWEVKWDRKKPSRKERLAALREARANSAHADRQATALRTSLGRWSST
jgi:hypothetical protein